MKCNMLIRYGIHMLKRYGVNNTYMQIDYIDITSNKNSIVKSSQRKDDITNINEDTVVRNYIPKVQTKLTKLLLCIDNAIGTKSAESKYVRDLIISLSMNLQSSNLITFDMSLSREDLLRCNKLWKRFKPV